MAKCSDRLQQAMSLRNIKQVDLCEMTNIPKSAMSQYISGKFKPKQKRIYAIAKALDVNEAWLMGLDAPMKRICVEDIFTGCDQAKTAIERAALQVLPESDIYQIPIYESVSAGFGATASDYIIGYTPLYIKNPHDAKNTMCVRVVGDSMYPKIEDGDIVQVLKQDSVDSGSLAVVLIDGEDGVVKKVKYGDDWIELVSINPMYPPRRFEGEYVLRCNVVGLVKAIIKTC